MDFSTYCIKVREAAKRGGAAVVLYNDPADSNLNMTYNVYPATWWLPGDDVEHGNTRSSWGDPATPGHAATGMLMVKAVFIQALIRNSP